MNDGYFLSELLFILLSFLSFFNLLFATNRLISVLRFSKYTLNEIWNFNYERYVNIQYELLLNLKTISIIAFQKINKYHLIDLAGEYSTQYFKLRHMP